MRIGLLALLSCLAISFAGNGGSAAAAAKQTCTTDPYGTKTCTDNADTKAPKKTKATKKPKKSE